MLIGVIFFIIGVVTLILCHTKEIKNSLFKKKSKIDKIKETYGISKDPLTDKEIEYGLKVAERINKNRNPVISLKKINQFSNRVSKYNQIIGGNNGFTYSNIPQ